MVLVACGTEEQAAPPTPTGTASTSPTPTATSTPPVTATPEGTIPPTEAASLPETLLQTLRKDLAETLVGVDAVDSPDLLEVVRVEQVASPDDCLSNQSPPADCPPAEFTPGYRVTLRRLDFGVEYVYYTAGGERFGGPWQLRLPLPTPVFPDVLPSRLLDLLREDLAERLDVTPDSIELALVEETVWGGCLGVSPPPAPGDGACLPSGLMLGYRVTLSAAGGEHLYHTEREEPFLRIYVGPVNNQ